MKKIIRIRGFVGNLIKSIMGGKLRGIILYGLLLISISTIFFGGTERLLIDRVIGFIIIFGLLGILRILVLSIIETISKERNFHCLLKVSVSIAIVLTFLIEVVDFTRPIVSSGLIELHYDLITDSGKPILIPTPHGTFIIEKIKNDIRYKIYFPRKIVEVENIASESSLTKQRMNWIKFIDFGTNKQYIESRHQLNLHADEWKIGKFMISYKYRLGFVEYLMRPTKIIMEKITG